MVQYRPLPTRPLRPPPRARRWYCFDDSHVSAVDDPASVVTAAAYVLFYVQRGYPALAVD